MTTTTLKDVLRQAPVLQRIRSIATFWIADQTLQHLEAIRRNELAGACGMMPPDGRLLEIGAGAGWQAQALQQVGYGVSAIDLPTSGYSEDRVFPIVDYDGVVIPFGNDTFDVVFSSNVLEHIPHVHEFQKEIRRVLKPDGYAVHLLPSSTWRLWTDITEPLRSLWPPSAHGEHTANAWKEIYCFRRGWWERVFLETGWTIVTEDTNGIFYTGASIMDARLSIEVRRKLSRFLGSSCNVFVLRNHT